MESEHLLFGGKIQGTITVVKTKKDSGTPDTPNIAFEIYAILTEHEVRALSASQANTLFADSPESFEKYSTKYPVSPLRICAYEFEKEYEIAVGCALDSIVYESLGAKSVMVTLKMSSGYSVENWKNLFGYAHQIYEISLEKTQGEIQLPEEEK